MVYGRYNELVNGVYKPTYNWGAPSCIEMEVFIAGNINFHRWICFLGDLAYFPNGKYRPFGDSMGNTIWSFNGKTQYKWPFSMAMLDNQMVCFISPRKIWDLAIDLTQKIVFFCR